MIRIDKLEELYKPIKDLEKKLYEERSNLLTKILYEDFPIEVGMCIKYTFDDCHYYMKVKKFNVGPDSISIVGPTFSIYKNENDISQSHFMWYGDSHFNLDIRNINKRLNTCTIITQDDYEEILFNTFANVINMNRKMISK